jgi:hypothetical protein
LAVAKETLFVIILLISKRKSLIFIMSAILLKFKVTIVVALYVKLKR